MSDIFSPGDILIFQIEAGYGLLRVIGTSAAEAGKIWHISAYSDLYMDIEMADEAASKPDLLDVSIPHIALTERAFLSTQVSRLGNITLTENELAGFSVWQNSEEKEVSDRSIRLLLGLR